MDWHKRYLQQAAWTQELRSYLWARAGLRDARRVLEIGCGSGAILIDVVAETPLLTPPAAGNQTTVVGIDIDRGAASASRHNAPRALLAQANALSLPFPSRTFDIVFCHYALLWIGDPLAALREMARTAVLGGQILVLAEPDYTKRADQPSELVHAGELQTRSLQRQGADVSVGSRLPELFDLAGIRLRETGPLQPSAIRRDDTESGELEWLVLESDLTGIISADELTRIRHLDQVARRRGLRRTFVPTFFAWGQV